MRQLLESVCVNAQARPTVERVARSVCPLFIRPPRRRWDGGSRRLSFREQSHHVPAAGTGRAAARLACLCALLLLSWAGRAAASEGSRLEIKVGRNVRVSGPKVPHVEAYIAAHPADADALIISASQVVPGVGIAAVAYSTSDGGVTWSPAALPEMLEMLARGSLRHAIDNWVTYAPDGTAFYSTLAWMKIEDKWRLPVLVYRSNDRGRTWLAPSMIPAASFDRPALVAAASEGGVRLFVSANVSGRDGLVMARPADADALAVMRSDDGGRTFAVVGFPAADNLGRNSMNPLVLPDGSLLVPYVDYPRRPGQLLNSSRIYVMRSADGGRSFGASQLVADIPRPYPGNPQFAVDASAGPYRGRVYGVWNGGPDEGRNVSAAYSSDGGRSWTPSRFARAENAATPYHPAVAVSGRGVVGAAWVQAEAKPRARCWRIYFTASADGGATFMPPQAVSEVVSCPDAEENKIKFPPSDSTVIERWARGGDYIGVAAAADGSFHLTWVDGRDGPFQVYTARVTVGREPGR